MFALFALFTATAFAYDAKLEAFPPNPYVFTADHEAGVPAPWSKVRFRVTNDGAQTLAGDGVEFEVTTAEGRVVRYRQAREFEVHPGETIELPVMYFGNLPESANFEYKVTARLLGYATPTGDPAEATVSFTTK